MARSARKKLVLLFPPLTQPTSPPLGVAALKGYMQEHVPGWEAKILDLNLLAHDLLLGLYFRRGGLNPQIFPEGVLAEIALQSAAEAFRGKRDHDFFEQPDRYSLYADLFLRFQEHEQAGLAQLEGWLASARPEQPLPGIIERFAADTLKEQPAAVGISLCYSQQLMPALALGKAFKQNTALPVIFGGSFFNELHPGTAAAFTGIADFIVCGEGEIGLAEVLNDLGGSWSRTPDAPPAVVMTEPEKVLDRIGTPDFSDLDLSRYYSPKPVIPLLSSRGCYWRRCAFCVHYKSAGLTYRRNSCTRFLEEIKAHCERGAEHFAFIDEMLSPHHFREIAEALIANRLSVNYYALAKPTKQFDGPLLEKIAASGCKYILWGLESASQRVLDLMDKGTRVEEVAEVLKLADAHGLFNHVYIMAGFPTETKDEYRETTAFLLRHQTVIHGVHRGTFRLEAGSPVFDNPEKFGITQITAEKATPFYQRYAFSCASGMSKAEVQEEFAKSLPLLRAFNYYSPRLGNFRDHALLIYARHGSRLKRGRRALPPA